jgi:hypothetical protein
MLHAQQFIHPQLVPHRKYRLNYKYQQQKEFVDLWRFSRNFVMLSCFNHYWNAKINCSLYLMYTVYLKYAILKLFNRYGRSNQWRQFRWGTRTKCMGIWEKNAHVWYKKFIQRKSLLERRCGIGWRSIKTEYECVEFVHPTQVRILWLVDCHSFIDLRHITAQDF